MSARDVDWECQGIIPLAGIYETWTLEIRSGRRGRMFWWLDSDYPALLKGQCERRIAAGGRREGVLTPSVAAGPCARFDGVPRIGCEGCDYGRQPLAACSRSLAESTVIPYSSRLSMPINRFGTCKPLRSQRIFPAPARYPASLGQ
jgi:hypothetical protein